MQIICSGCEKEKKKYAKGLCKTCYIYQWRAKNPGRHKEICKKSYEKRKGKILPKLRVGVISEKKRLEQNARRRAYYNANKKKVLESVKRYEEANKEQIMSRQKDYYKRNRRRIIDRVNAYNQADPERFKAIRKKVYAKNKYKVMKANHERRCRVRSGDMTEEKWLGILEEYGHRCPSCGSSGKLSMDHIVPVVAGGLHTSDNIQPLCRRCNSKKGTCVEFYPPLTLSLNM